jgi:hypothetical protein
MEALVKTSLLVMFLMVPTCLAMPYVASADLIFDSSLGGVAGSGLGTVLTILTIQSPGSGSVESGSTGRASGADVTSDVGVLASGGTMNFGGVEDEVRRSDIRHGKACRHHEKDSEERRFHERLH